MMTVDLSRYAGSAWGGETENGALRWDRNLPTRPEPARVIAQKAVEDMRPMVDGIEAHLFSCTPQHAGTVRDAWAPLYYDLARATRIAMADGEMLERVLEEHIVTKRIAKFIATERPAMLSPAQADALNKDAATEDDYAREYLLFTHSILPEDLDLWPDDARPLPLAEGHMQLRSWTIDAAQRIDRSLRTRLGLLTRSPIVALVASAQASPYALLRGFVLRPRGDVVFAEVNDPVTDENEAAYLFAMSIGMRHASEAQRGFDARLREDASGNRDKSRHVSAPGLLAAEHLEQSPIDGHIGHFPTEFGRAFAHDPDFPHRPSQESAEHARRLLQ